MWSATGAQPARRAVSRKADGGLRALRRARRRRARKLSVGVLCALGISGGVVWAAFTSSASPGSIALSSLSLSAYAPASVSASRIGPTTCRVTWTASAAPGAPAGLTYDVSDGVTTLATAVSGLTTDLSTNAQVTPVVRARLANWTSSTSTTSGSFCTGVPGAPTGVTLTAGDGQLAVTWTAPAGNGGTAITGYTATANPGAVTCTSATPAGCTISGLTNGTTYTVTVTATNAVGTGPASTGVADIPYPASIMSSGATKVWLDAQKASTLRSDTAGTNQAAAGGAVQRWNTRTGSGWDAVKTSAPGSPVLNATAINGRPAVRFDRTHPDYLDVTAAGIGAVGSADRSVFAVATMRTTTDNSTNYSGSLAIWPGAHSGLYGSGYPSITNVAAYGWTSGGGTVNSSTSVGTSPTLVSGVFTSDASSVSSSVAANGAVAGSASTSGSWRVYGDLLRIGASNAAGTGSYESDLDGDIGEVIVLNRAVTTTERRTIAEYLARKWGVAIIPRAPGGVTATNADGSTAVTWSTPSWDGGSAITGFTAGAVPSGGGSTLTCTASGAAATGCSIVGLTNGLTYTVTVTATNAAGPSAASIPVTVNPYPSTVMTSARMRLWLDGGDATTMFQDQGATTPATGSGQPVALWRDKSGQADDATQATAASRPVLTAAGGRLVPGFDGSDDALDMLDSSKLPNGTTSSTAFVAAAPGDGGTRTALVWGGGTGTSRSTFTTGGFLCVDPYYAGSSACVSGVVAGRSLIMDSRVTAGGVSIAADGGADATTAQAMNTGTGLAELGEPATRWYGPMSEVIVFTGTLTTAERRQVTEYLARKWGGSITPQAPTGVTAAPGDGTAAVSWTVPAWNGGSAVTGYTASATDGTSTFTCTASGAAATGCTISGLTNGLTYTVTVTATNAVGTGPASGAASAIPYPASILTSGATKVWLDAQQVATLRADTAGVSQASSGGSVQRWNTRTGSGWDAIKGALAGGSPTLQATAINGRPAVRFDRTHPDYFEITNSGVGAVGSADRSLFAVAALRTTADNSTNAYSAIATWPGYHSGLVGNGYPNVTSVSGPAWSSGLGGLGGTVGAGSSALVADTVASSAGGVLTAGISANGGASSASSVSGSWLGYSDMFRVGAANYRGQGNYEWDLDGDIGELIVLNRAATSTERRTVDEYLARKWAVAITPQAPTGVSASPGAGSAGVTWTVPAWDGGSAITGYTATAVPSDGSPALTCTASGAAATGCTVNAMVSGLSYTVTVTATNGVGTGPASGSAPVTPTGTTTPSRPVGLSLTLGNAQITASWSAPASDGGSAVTGYTVTASPSGSCTAFAPATSCTVPGLTAGTTYTFTVTATNGIGTGAASASASATAVSAPGAPTGVTLTPGTGGSATTIATTWTAPASNGGLAISGYTVNVSPAPSTACSPVGAATSCSFTGSAGTTYTVTVQATNAVGTGPASGSKATYVFANPGFEAGTLTGWTLTNSPTATNTMHNNGSWSAALAPSTQISQTVTGLTPNTSYTFSAAYAKNGGSPTGRIGVSGITGATFTSVSGGNSFVPGSVTFTTGAGETSATLYLSGVSNTTYFDDAVLKAN